MAPESAVKRWHNTMTLHAMIRQVLGLCDWSCYQLETGSEKRAALDQVGRAIFKQSFNACVARAVDNKRPNEAIRDLKDALDRFVECSLS